ncbi:MAG: DUF2306 domain-containing protein [Pseudomonadota bacterium]
MSELKLTDGAKGRSPMAGWYWPLAAAVLIYVVASALILRANPDAEIRFRIDVAPLLAAETALKIHVGSAIGAFFLGLAIMLAPKGVGLHKQMGWTWVALMAATAISSFWLTGLAGGGFSPIHGLSAWVVIGLPMGLAAIRRRNVKAHSRHMTGMFMGAMAIAGLFTFLPGRLMWSLFFGA